MDKAVFLDRDGTVIVDRGYLDCEEGVELLEGAGRALRVLATAGFRLVLITNQSGIGRGYFTKATVDRQHERLTQLLAPYGVTFDAIEMCPHAPEEKCTCRKPRPALILHAAHALNIRLEESYMVGDKATDVEAGRHAGCHSIILGTHVAGAAYAATSLLDAAHFIVKRSNKKDITPHA